MTDKIVPSNDAKEAVENALLLATLAPVRWREKVEEACPWPSFDLLFVGTRLILGQICLMFASLNVECWRSMPDAPPDSLGNMIVMCCPFVAIGLLFSATAVLDALRMTKLFQRLPRGFVKRFLVNRRESLRFNQRIRLANTYARMPGGKAVVPEVSAKWAVEREALSAGLHSIMDDLKKSRSAVPDKLDEATKNRAAVLAKLERAVLQAPATTASDTQDLSDYVFLATERDRVNAELSKADAGPDWLENEFRSLESETTETLAAEPAATSK